jgi:lysozyme
MKKKIIIVILLVILLGAAVVSGFSAYRAVRSKRLLLNDFFVKESDIRGVDISSYQQSVDMNALKQQGVSFVYIKATEGSSSVDDCFKANWQNAFDAGLPAGAYHFFSFDSPGKTQADNFIETVGDMTGRLIPAVDIEYYTGVRSNPPEKEAVIRELLSFCNEIESRCGVKPMIYATKEMYNTYLKGWFDSYPRWVRSVYYHADFEAKNNWVMWQYCDIGQLDGYSGGEKYIDLNVINRDRSLEEITVR